MDDAAEMERRFPALSPCELGRRIVGRKAFSLACAPTVLFTLLKFINVFLKVQGVCIGVEHS